MNQQIDKETWKDIEGYEGLYQVSNLGRVKSLGADKFHKGIIKKLHKRADGYIEVCLSKNKKIRNIKVHRIVAQAFVPNPHNLTFVNHIDESKENNAFDNLEWCNRSYNMRYGTLIKRALLNRKYAKKEIGQYTIDGFFIRYWDSITSASKAIGISKTSIQKCLKNDLKSAGGFTWKEKIIL